VQSRWTQEAIGASTRAIPDGSATCMAAQGRRGAHRVPPCARGHRGEGASGEPVPIAEVGTDPSVGSSPDRGTGSYRVPSLRFVGDGERPLANGAVEDVRALLEPSRAAPGHRFGTTLADVDRRALLAYLDAL
jgi:hypothetical protein